MNKITFTEEFIGPDKAAEYLAKNHPNNRNEKPSSVEIYANDIKEGRWRVTHQGIAFDTNNYLIDGANRMRAIIKANTPAIMFVARGLDPETVLALDNNSRRTVGDALKVAGRPVHTVGYTSILWGMQGFDGGSGRPKKSYTQSLAFEDKHREAAIFALRASTRGGGEKVKGIISGHFLGPIARAWYTADRTRIHEFVEVVKTGFSNGRKDDAAIALRNWLLRSGVSHERFEVYRKTESALFAFLKHESLDKVYETKTELFPIPE